RHRARQFEQARRRCVLDRDGQSQLDASVRCRRTAAALRGHSQIDHQAGRRSVPLAGRRTAPRRRVRQGHDAVQRISLGRFPAPAHQAQAGRPRFRSRHGKGHAIGQKPGRQLPARLVRRLAGRVSLAPPPRAMLCSAYWQTWGGEVPMRFDGRMSRRASLGAAASVIAAPALAEECHIGPPEHPHGANVWMNMDQVELDAAYDQSFYAPLARQILARVASDSELARQRLGLPRREAYGPSEVEKLDIWKTKHAKAPIFLFIHGGAWLAGEAKNYAYPAEMFVNAGAHFVVPDFIQIRAANGDLRTMAEQVRRAIAWTYKNAASFDGDPERLYIGGHSSGGHLC